MSCRCCSWSSAGWFDLSDRVEQCVLHVDHCWHPGLFGTFVSSLKKPLPFLLLASVHFLLFSQAVKKINHLFTTIMDFKSSENKTLLDWLLYIETKATVILAITSTSSLLAYVGSSSISMITCWLKMELRLLGKCSKACMYYVSWATVCHETSH